MREVIRLVEPLIPALRRYARAMLRDRDAADDLVQDCLERALVSWHLRRVDGDVRAWLFTILHNLAINALKRTARRGRHLPLEDVAEVALLHPPAQDTALALRDLLDQVAALPEEQRSVLLLVSVEGLSYAEAARVQGVPVGTVMSRLSRARDKLLHATENGAASANPGQHLRRVK